MLSPTVPNVPNVILPSSLKRGPLNDRIGGGGTDWGLKINTEHKQQQTTTPCACSSACSIHCCGVSQIRTKNRSLGAARVNDQPAPGVPSICRRMPGLDRSTTTTTKASFTSGERSHQWFDWPSQIRTEPDSQGGSDFGILVLPCYQQNEPIERTSAGLNFEQRTKKKVRIRTSERVKFGIHFRVPHVRTFS